METNRALTPCSSRVGAWPLQLALLVLGAGCFEGAYAVGEQLPLPSDHYAICNVETLQGSFTSTEHRYTGSGFCSIVAPGSTRGNASTFPTPVATHRWTLDGRFEPGTGRTTERLEFPSRGAAVQVVQRCPADPWLDDKDGGCSVPQIDFVGPVEEERDAVSKAQLKSPAPFTSQGLARTNFGPQLRAQYERATALARATAGSLRDSSAARSGATIGAASAAGAVTPASSLGGRTTVERPPSTTVQVNDSTARSPSTAGALQIPSTAKSTTPMTSALQIPSTAQGGAASAPAPAPAAMPQGGAGSVTAPAPAPVPQGGAASETRQDPIEGGGLSKGSGGGGSGSTVARTAPITAPTVGSDSAWKGGTLAAAPQSSSAALRITAPVAGAEVRQDQLRVQVAAQGAAVRDVEVEFTNLSPKPNEDKAAPATRLQWTITQDQLAKGVVVPAGSGPRASGRWQMRVRPAGSTVWSEPVAFAVVAANEPKGNAFGRKSDELERQGLNPQPLPPKEAKKANPYERQGLNPQPLPPKEGAAPASTFQR